MTDNGPDRCECCHLDWDVTTAPCGHRFCTICRDRGHNDPCEICQEKT